MDKRKMVWVDLETTGLSVSSNIPIEIGVIITDVEGNKLASYTSLLHDEPLDFTFKNMSDEVVQMHMKSGLIKDLRDTDIDDRKTVAMVEQDLIEWLESQGLKAGNHPMCGSTVHFDRNFIEYWMPTLFNWFHYRNIDVSTLRGLCGLVNPEVAKAVPGKRGIHRPLADLEDSITEYKFFLDNFLHVALPWSDFFSKQ